jgi:hypothetical protein
MDVQHQKHRLIALCKDIISVKGTVSPEICASYDEASRQEAVSDLSVPLLQLGEFYSLEVKTVKIKLR